MWSQEEASEPSQVCLPPQDWAGRVLDTDTNFPNRPITLITGNVLAYLKFWRDRQKLRVKQTLPGLVADRSYVVLNARWIHARREGLKIAKIP
jgi:hypothetical protein